MSLEEIFRSAKKYNHINEYSYMLLLFRKGESESFSSIHIAASDQMEADKMAEKDAELYDCRAAAFKFPEQYHSAYAGPFVTAGRIIF